MQALFQKTFVRKRLTCAERWHTITLKETSYTVVEGECVTRETTCCFTGHRPDKLPWRDREDDPRCLRLKRRIEEALEEAYQRGYRHFICGMARGCDFYFCEAAAELRSRRRDMTLEAALPCTEQAERWREADQRRHQRLLDKCDLETVVQQRYSNWCMQRRDRYMVDRSGLLIAAYDGSASGGTLYTLTYALRQGLDTIVLDIEE